MKNAHASVALAGLLAVWSVGAAGTAAQDQKPKVAIPQPGVPQVMTIEGNFVRAAYNNVGYVILGYKTANMSIGEEWLLLDIGATVRDNVGAFTLKRDDITLTVPDGSTLPLPTKSEYNQADLRALDRRANVARDSINYFPPMASKACRIGFFAEPGSQVMAWDQVELSNTRACVGRIYFKIPGGIKYGQHWLDVKFPGTVVRVPFKILTKDEEKMLSKNYRDIRKQIQEAFKPPKKEKAK